MQPMLFPFPFPYQTSDACILQPRSTIHFRRVTSLWLKEQGRKGANTLSVVILKYSQAESQQYVPIRWPCCWNNLQTRKHSSSVLHLGNENYFLELLKYILVCTVMKKREKKGQLFCQNTHLALIHNIPEQMHPTVIFLPKCYSILHESVNLLQC